MHKLLNRYVMYLSRATSGLLRREEGLSLHAGFVAQLFDEVAKLCELVLRGLIHLPSRGTESPALLLSPLLHNP